MPKRFIEVALVTLCLVLVPVSAGAYDEEALSLNQEGPAIALAPEVALTSQSATIYGVVQTPGWIQPYEAKCSLGGPLKVEIMDCCMPGDHWMVRAKVFDLRPTPFQVISDGSTSQYAGVEVRPYSGAYTSYFTTRALIAVEYCHGINVFGAGFTLRMTCLRPGSILSYTTLDQAPNLR